MSELEQAENQLHRLITERDALRHESLETRTRLQKTRLLIGRDEGRLRVRQFVEDNGLKPVLFIVVPFATLVLPGAVVAVTFGGIALPVIFSLLCCVTASVALYFCFQYPASKLLRARLSEANSSVMSLGEEKVSGTNGT